MSRRRLLSILAAAATGSLAARALPAHAMERDQVWELARRGARSHRMGNFTVRLHRSDGSPVRNTPVRARLKQHEFSFGMIFRPRHYNDDWYREQFLKLFNFVELLEFNWGQYEPDEGKPLVDERHRFLREWCLPHGIDRFYGHMLVWTTQYGEYPKTNLPLWLFKYPPDRQWQLLLHRIRREVTDYSEFNMIWDVVNEPIHLRPWGKWEEPIRQAAPIPQILPYVLESLRAARQANPKATLLINEYRILAKNRWRDRLSQLLAALQKARAPLDMLGIQAHPYKARHWHPPETIWGAFEHFGGHFRIPILITEHCYTSSPDVPIGGTYRRGNWSADRQADAVEEFYRLAFGSPHVAGLVYFAMADDDAWRPGIGLFDVRRRPKPVWDRLNQLIKHEWTTELTTASNVDGLVQFRGYYGTYRLDVGEGKERKTVAVKLNRGVPQPVPLVIA